MSQSHAEINLEAYRENLATIGEIVGDCDLMAVVKAEAYGHGMIPIARAAREAQVDWLGVATITEALALRAAGDTGRIFSWVSGDEFDAAIENDIDLSVSTMNQLQAITATSKRARIHLKIDTGLSRNGATVQDWPMLVQAATQANVEIVGVWSHFAAADEPNHPANQAQEAAFAEALSIAAELGVRPPVRHLANSAAALLRPQSRFDLVRIGIASFGYSPAPQLDHDFGLKPVLTLKSTLINVKSITRGSGVSYGHRFIAEHDTRVGLIPLGYGDGIARAMTGGEVLVNGHRVPIIGAVCMDQIIVELGDTPAGIGDEVILFGPGDAGEPTGQDWAVSSNTIHYEVLTRLSARIPRVFI